MNFDDNIKTEDFDLYNILIDEKSFEKILVYNILHESLIYSKPLRIRFDKIDGFIRVYFRTGYLILFGREKYDSIYDRIRYAINVIGDITYIKSHNYAKIEVDSCNCLHLEKAMTLCNAIILVKPVWKKKENNYYCNMILEKTSYELPKK